MSKLLYTFYGDDFTGSTDVLEQLALGGVRAALFLQPPTVQDVQFLPGLQAVGVAGDSRSQSPEWMSVELPAVFESLRALGAPVTQYKVCSTFDSSPRRGNIGRAMELGLAAFGAPYVPIVVGAPHLRRHVWHGMLFASDADGVVQRIDRHPMSRHPATPMREPRLALHLAQQTALPIGAVGQAQSQRELERSVDEQVREGKRAVLFDSVDAQDLAMIGGLLWEQAQQHPMFSVGSSGLTAALISAWQRQRMIEPAREQKEAGESPKHKGPLLVISGSCSAVTERQLRWAQKNGFTDVAIGPEALLQASDAVREQLADNICTALLAGHDVVAYTAMGSPEAAAHGDELGAALGDLLKAVLQRTDVKRVLLCGGDTSSQAVRRLGLRALVWQADLQRGVPLCRAYAEGPLNGLELALKGGQMGTEDFFAVVRDA